MPEAKQTPKKIKHMYFLPAQGFNSDVLQPILWKQDILYFAVKCIMMHASVDFLSTAHFQ